MKISKTGFWQGENDEVLYHVCCHELSNWLIEYLKDQKDCKLYDFGCGLGAYLKAFQNANFTKLVGYEGEVPKHKDFDNIKCHDLSTPLYVSYKGNCICLEVGEHIPSEYENILINNITDACNDNLILSWAVPGQDGNGHVNCRSNQYIIDKITAKGFRFLQKETEEVRKVITNDYHWFKNTVMIFKRIY